VSDNVAGAGNQQERLPNEESRFWFLAGLVEGEGSVCLNIKRHPTVWSGYYVQPAFFLYQHRLRVTLLEMAKEYFGTGRIAPKPGNPDVLVYSIQSRRAISATVVPFLEKCMALSARRADYEKFVAAVRLFEAGLHKDPWGLALIVDIAYSMNMDGKQRRIPREEILGRILRGHTPNAPGQGRRDGPTSVATRRARRNRNDLAPQASA
jgi:LAGLIDADG endonuclease